MFDKKEYDREYYLKNRERLCERQREWGKNNKEEKARRDRLYYEKNKEKIREYKKEYYSDEDNLKHKHEQDRKYSIVNRDKALARVKEYYENNKERCKHNARIGKHKYRALENKSPGSHTRKEIEEILVSQNYRCVVCGSDLTVERRHLDHIQPLSRGGCNCKYNLQWLCEPCNLSKNDKTMEEYLIYREAILETM